MPGDARFNPDVRTRQGRDWLRHVEANCRLRDWNEKQSIALLAALDYIEELKWKMRNNG
jgi:hypothetical protein